MEKILLGYASDNLENFELGEKIYITKHSWDCGWYWGCGYIGNKNIHTHFVNTFIDNTMVWKHVEDCFSKTKITENEWWIIKDLFKQIDALKTCAEIYRHGGHCITSEETKVIENRDKANEINKDLEIVLNTVWKLLEKIDSRK